LEKPCQQGSLGGRRDEDIDRLPAPDAVTNKRQKGVFGRRGNESLGRKKNPRKEREGISIKGYGGTGATAEFGYTKERKTHNRKRSPRGQIVRDGHLKRETVGRGRRKGGRSGRRPPGVLNEKKNCMARAPGDELFEKTRRKRNYRKMGMSSKPSRTKSQGDCRRKLKVEKGERGKTHERNTRRRKEVLNVWRETSSDLNRETREKIPRNRERRWTKKPREALWLRVALGGNVGLRQRLKKLWRKTARGGPGTLVLEKATGPCVISTMRGKGGRASSDHLGAFLEANDGGGSKGCPWPLEIFPEGDEKPRPPVA